MRPGPAQANTSANARTPPITAAPDIPGASARADFVFRVNRDVVVLNDVTPGNVWLVTENMRLVANWDDVIPPPDKTEDQDEDRLRTTTR